MSEKNENQRLTEEEALNDYQQMVDQIEKEIVAIISQYGADEDVKRSNAGHIANLANRVIDRPVPDTSEDRIYWHIRNTIAKTLSGGVSDEMYRYTDNRLIDTGGFEADYVIALFADEGTPLAMKSLKPDATVLATEAFKNEQTVLSRLYFTYRSKYPDTLLQLFAIGDGVTVTERVKDGSNLNNELGNVRDLNTIVGWFSDICDGLGKLYDAGYERHGDVSSKNCILGSDGRVRVGDFSLTSDETYFNDGNKAICGNSLYMAPETVLSYRTNDIKPIVDKRADIYGLGVLLYQILTKGKDPYGRDESTMQASKDHGIYHDDALLLASFAKTIKESNYTILFFLRSGGTASRTLIDFFAEKYFHTRIDYPINQFGIDKETAQALDLFIADCLSFNVERRPKNPDDFFKKLVAILEKYID